MLAILRKLYYRLSVKQRYTVRKLIHFPQDLFRDKKTLIPPKGMIYTGSGDFVKIGNSFFEYFKKHGEINPNFTILDVGSGIGRVAIPFSKYLSKKGRYYGFDIVEQGVNWCTNNISSKYPNFKFEYVSLKNDLYNTASNNTANNFTFPYKNNKFDFVFLTSVFTHMLPNDVNNYLKEINRVLKQNKKCIATFFILDTISSNLMINSEKNFKHNFENYALMDKKVKEANVAYKKEFLFEMINNNGFEIESFHEGNWSGRKTTCNTFSSQDILILKKL
ncbi:class I SAM-dependent methyltransferase [Seonamhaeicola aphaedonensis]|uniref:Methyltransferase family protein n=1 Tax=Seonamhaeicola aphaedonensis TaxID=1461338 RepID=A0A3D9HGR6_9FLAO|nr:class I SAM-dependent methyltransferase [Seonamhaeicola aphaedonensis]RED48196.1 methyltransferase family protein [Seonamhaeicola aphaedonensis]